MTLAEEIIQLRGEVHHALTNGDEEKAQACLAKLGEIRRKFLTNAENKLDAKQKEEKEEETGQTTTS